MRTVAVGFYFVTNINESVKLHVPFGTEINHKHTYTLYEIILFSHNFPTWQRCGTSRLYPTNLTYTESLST